MNTGTASLSDEQRTTIQHAADKLRTVWANHTGDKESRELCHKLEALLAITPPVDSALKNHGVPLDVAWSEKNGKENWGHEPTAKGLFEDGWNAAMLFWGLSDSRDGGTGLSNTPQADAAPSVDAIATELWKAADACGFEQFRETVRAAIAAGGAQEAMQMLLSKVPIPPNAITFDKGWELLDEPQRVALLAASNGEKKNV